MLGPSTTFGVGLGAWPLTHGNRRRGPVYKPQHSAVADTSSSCSVRDTSLTQMSPNMTYEAVPSYSPRLTVAQRKEALELRKTMKPLMEKRRRARINDCLNRLKDLIVPLTGKDKTRYSKLEKADILEMTVRFLSNIPPGTARNSTESYREGYAACLQRVSALLPKTSLDRDACRRVEDFLRQSTSASPALTPTCLNCCAQSSSVFPHIQQRLLSLKSSAGARLDSRARGSGGGATVPLRAPQNPQAASAAVWRPW